MLRVWVADVRDRRNDFPQESNSVTKVVLDDLFDGDVLQGDLDVQPPEAPGDQVVSGGLADGA